MPWSLSWGGGPFFVQQIIFWAIPASLPHTVIFANVRNYFEIAKAKIGISLAVDWLAFSPFEEGKERDVSEPGYEPE